MNVIISAVCIPLPSWRASAGGEVQFALADATQGGIVECEVGLMFRGASRYVLASFVVERKKYTASTGAVLFSININIHEVEYHWHFVGVSDAQDWNHSV